VQLVRLMVGPAHPCDGIDIGSTANQQCDHCAVSVERSNMQSGAAILVREVYRRAVVQQHFRADCVVVQRGRVQGRPSSAGAVVRREVVGIAQQQPQIFVAPVLRCQQQLLHRLHPKPRRFSAQTPDSSGAAQPASLTGVSGMYTELMPRRPTLSGQRPMRICALEAWREITITIYYKYTW
jgi:hypothetical protein